MICNLLENSGIPSTTMLAFTKKAPSIVVMSATLLLGSLLVPLTLIGMGAGSASGI